MRTTAGGVTVASFNIHAGVDGWGRSFDAVGACARLDTDVLVVQEDWAPEGHPGLSDAIAERSGYTLSTVCLARGWLYPVPGDAGPGFGPGSFSRRQVGIRLDSSPAARGRRAGVVRPPGTERGDWRLAVMTRLPVLSSRPVELERLRRDPARRFALMVTVETPTGPLTIVGVHMSHLTQGSLVQFAQLRRELPRDGTPALVTGDMNLWGPPLRLLLPGWRSAVRGRTWPSWRPLAQIDHILVNPGLACDDGEVQRPSGSDHLAVRARVYPRAQSFKESSPARP